MDGSKPRRVVQGLPWGQNSPQTLTGHAVSQLVSLCPAPLLRFAAAGWSPTTAAASVLPGVSCSVGLLKASLSAKSSSKGSQTHSYRCLQRNILPPYSSTLRADRAVAISQVNALGSSGSLGIQDVPQKQEGRAWRCYVNVSLTACHPGASRFFWVSVWLYNPFY